MTSILRVSLNDKAVGTLTLLPSGGTFFAFDEAYINDTNRPVLSQSFFSSTGGIIPESRSAAGRLPIFFANLLPEGHMRDYLAQRGNVKPSNEFKLIELLGQDLSGAVTITPLDGAALDVPARDEAPRKLDQPLRFSLAGVQLKFSALAGKHGGLAVPASGMGGDWIVKLPAQNFMHVPENEYAMMDLASAIGIPVPEIKLVPLADIKNLPEMGVLAGKQALAVKRFDRAPNGQRIHIEDFAQVYNAPPDKKYEGVSYDNIAGMVWALTGESGLTDFIRRLTFCIVIGNGDMHLKNWSFIYEDGRTPALSPAYDLLSSIPFIPEDRLALKLGDTKDMKDVNLQHFKKLAKKAGVPEHLVLQTVRETVDATKTAWAKKGKEYDLPANIQKSIQAHMDDIEIPTS